MESHRPVLVQGNQGVDGDLEVVNLGLLLVHSISFAPGREHGDIEFALINRTTKLSQSGFLDFLCLGLRWDVVGHLILCRI